MKKLTPVVALTCVFMLACCFVVVSAASSALAAKLGMDQDQTGALVGSLNSLFLLVACIFQFFIGPINDRVGHKPLAIFGFIVTGVSMFLLYSPASLSVAKFACVLLGFGAMSLNTVGNTIIPQVLFEGKNPARASNFGNAFFGLGIVLTPLFVELMKKTNLGGAGAVLILAILNLLFLFLAFGAQFPAANIGFKFSTAFKLLAQPPVFMAALALFCYIGLENTMNGFLRPYAAKIFGEGAFMAGFTLTLFGIAMMTGRFIASGYKKMTEKGNSIIIIAAIVSIVPMLILALTNNAGLTVIAAILAGLAFAPVFPTVLGITFSKYDPKYYGSIFGMIFAIGLGGSSIVVNRIGAMAKTMSLQQAFMIPVIVAIVLVVVAIVMGKAKPKPIA